MARLPINENENSLWLAIASNFYDTGIFLGLTGLTPPRAGENDFSLMKKVAYYTARIAAS